MFSKNESGYLGNTPSQPTHEVMLIEGKYYNIKKVVVHGFTVGDVDDPEIFAAEPIWNWQQTDAGKFVMENAIEPPVWHRRMDYNTYGHAYSIVAKMKDVDYTFWALKWGTK